MLGLTLLPTGLLPLKRTDSAVFRWQPACAQPARRLRVTAAAVAPPEASTAQKQAVRDIPVTQPPEHQNEGQPNPGPMGFLSSAISGITQLWMQQGSKAGGTSVELLQETAERAAEVNKLPDSFALLAHIASGRWAGGRGA